MTDQQKKQQALSAFEALCFALTKLGWDYEKNISELQIDSRVWGDDIPMDITVRTDVESAMFFVCSELPFEVNSEREADIALAVSMINVNLAYGNFSYDVQQEKVRFATQGSFDGCSMSVSVFEQILTYSVKVIDDYNDKLLLLADGLMTLDEFTVFLTDLLETERENKGVDNNADSDNETEKAEEVFRKIGNIVALKTSEYTVNDDDLSVNFTVTGEDLPMDITAKVEKENQIIKISSPMPYKISVDNRVPCALAVCATSAKITSGSFDYDIINGMITFRVSTPFRDCCISQELIGNMIVYASKVTDKYNDRFLALDKGFLKLEDFINQ